MSEYKVPQDVEADDKILGPFSFRQFIYLIIVALAITLAWGLSKLYIFLAIIPTPVILFFGALALPLRKDQPMETYLAAMVSFYLKPHRRIWDPDGIESLIEITAPKTPEVLLTKDISQDEAQRRLSYLADIVDTQGWAVRGVSAQPVNNAMNSDVYFEAQQAEDILDESNIITQTFDNRIQQSNLDRKEAMSKIISGQPTNYFDNQATEIIPTVAPANYYNQPMQTPEPVFTPESTTIGPIRVEYNPYPEIQQAVIQPLEEELATKTPKAEQPTQVATPIVASQPLSKPELPKENVPPNTSTEVPSADIINLARRNDLNIATIARQANLIRKKQDGEVVVSIHHDK